VFLIGLTGGIAAGKSTVASLWESLGATVIDADVLAREALAPGSAGLNAVSKLFEGVVDASGELDRKKLADIVFADQQKRKALEAIVHPIVSAESKRLIAAAKTEIVVYVVPLLVEANVDHPFDAVVTVEAPEKDQIARMVKSRGMSFAEATARIKSQASPAHRANRANYILNSNQEIELLMRDARRLYETFEASAT
jgi:dephospho-CoA kinase